MAIAVQGLRYQSVTIQSLDGRNKKDLTNSITSIDYYEDILSPCITMTMDVINSYSIFNLLPIRGGEKVSMEIETASGKFLLDGENAMYVYKVSNLDAQNTNESFTLHLVSREGLTNETVRCETVYRGNLKTTVTKILKDVLKTNKFKSENIEQTSNSYSFVGNNKKPFHILQWLGPKAVSAISGGATGTSGGDQSGIAKGTAGFFFYENRDGFNFRSIDSLVSNTRIEESSANKKKVYNYSYEQFVIQHNDLNNNFKIINYNYEKNIDLMKSLRVGMYANKTYFYDLYSNSLDLYKYTLKDQIKNKLGAAESIAVSEEFGDSVSRIMVKVADRGALKPDGSIGDKLISGADMSMSYSRYNLLFSQALNMNVPLNINLKCGDIIYAQFPKMEPSNNGEVDPEQSGFYLIKELRHHFDPTNKMLTSIRLIRDSYGLYGPKNL
jgi:hypothetical protein